MDANNINQDTLTIKEVTDILRIGANSAYNLIHRKDFPAIKINHSYRIPTQAFLQWSEKESDRSGVKVK